MEDASFSSLILDLAAKVDAGLLFCKNDRYSTILYANPYFYTMLGYTKEEVEERFNNHFSEMMVENIPDILDKVWDTVRKGDKLDFEYKMRRKDGKVIWIHDTAVYNQEQDAFYIALMDVSEKKSLQNQTNKLLAVLEHIPNKVFIADVEGKLEFINIQAKESFYYKAVQDQDGPLTVEKLFSKHITNCQFSDLWKKAAAGEVVCYETWFKENGKVLGQDRNYLVPIISPNLELGVANIMQVSEDLTKQNDSLTSLPNRPMFEHYFKQQMISDRDSLGIAFLMIDIDDFKSINDLYGHGVGDQAIQTTARRIISILDKGGYAARFGGDEFVLLLEIYHPEEMEQYIQRFLELGKQPLYVEGEQIVLTYSIGISYSSSGKIDYDTMLNQADTALYQVKQSGKNGYVIYNQDLEFMKNQQKLVQKIQEYIHNDESLIELRSYRSLKAGQSTIWEPVYHIYKDALVLREWACTEEQQLSVVLNMEIYKVALGHALRRFHRVLETDEQALLCLYLPIRILEKIDVVRFLTQMLGGISPKRLMLKISEIQNTCYASKWLENIRELQQAGFQLCLGNFGSGTSFIKLMMDFKIPFISLDLEFLKQRTINEKYAFGTEFLLRLAKLNDSKLIFETLEEDCQVEGLDFDYIRRQEKLILR